MSDLFQDIVSKIKPYVMGWIGEVNTGAAIGSHELSGSLHTGSLSDAQAPQFLKMDGSRHLIGNLVVAEGITIDGVDLSVFKAAYDTHAGLDAATAHGSVGLHSHQNNPQGGQLDHGLALTGLLDDDHTQYASADGSGTRRRAYEAQRLNKTITAGAGLTGGGLLTADRTLDVGQGFGVVVGADDVAVDTAAAFTWTNDHTFQGLTKTRHLHPELTDTYDLGSSTLLWRKGWLSELDAILFAQQTQTLVGGWLSVGLGEGSLPEDVADTDTQIDFGQAMTVGDFVLFRAALKVEYIQVGSLVSGTIYNVTRNLDGSGANDWPAGSVYAIRRNGGGWIDLNAYDTPRLQMVRQGATYNAQTELIRIGDLNGNWGYSAEKWGLAIGEYASGKPNITIDQDGVLRFRLHTTEVMKFEAGNADLTGKLRMPGTSSAIAIGSTPPTAANAGTGMWIDRTGLYSLASGTYQVKIDAVDGRLYAGGGNIYLGSQGVSFIIPSSYSRAASINFLNNTGTVVSQIFSTGTGTSTSFLRSIAGGSEETFYTTDGGNIQFSARGNLTGNFEAEVVVPNNRLELKAYASSGTRYIALSTIYLSERCDLTLWSNKVSLGYAFYPTFDVANGGYVTQSTAIACRAYRNTTQSIANNTWTAIQLNAEYFDDVPSGVTEMHNNSTNNTRITCRVNGVYHIVGNVQWENDATGDRMTAIRLNGSTYVGLNTTRARVSGNTNVNVSTVIKMSAGDFVELMAYQDRGSSLNAVYDASNQHATVMSVVRIA